MALDLDELERLLAEATPGEWFHERDLDPRYEDGLSDGRVCLHNCRAVARSDGENRINDARLIAALRNAAPEMLRVYRAVVEMGHARRNPKLSRHAIAEIEKRVVDIAYELTATTRGAT